ncbi:MAG: hypothetical protein ACRYFA_15025 [Janthinobacterium lividum]
MQLSDLDFEKSYTYADYMTWDFEERVELLRSKIYKITSPNRIHQKISGSIFFQIAMFLKGQKPHVYSKILTLGDEVTTPVLPGFVLNLEEVFEEASL